MNDLDFSLLMINKLMLFIILIIKKKLYDLLFVLMNDLIFDQILYYGTNK